MGNCCRRAKRSPLNDNKMPVLRFVDRPKLHDRPIVGIMAVVADHISLGHYWLPASYVKSVESSGARVVPVLPGQTELYYRRMFDSLNGLLIPGGTGAPITDQRQTTEAVVLFLRWSIAACDQEKSVYWPIWGTCLGIEMLLDIAEGKSGTLLSECRMAHRSFPLDLTPEAKDARLIACLPDDLKEALSKNPVVPHLHAYCVPLDRFNEKRLADFYVLVGTNRDRNGLTYVSAIEARRGYPIYAVMGHPEKSIYSWTKKFQFDRSLTSIRLAQEWMNFFVQECCKNDHHFASSQEEMESLIFNYQPMYTAKELPGSISDQCYYFAIERRTNSLQQTLTYQEEKESKNYGSNCTPKVCVERRHCRAYRWNLQRLHLRGFIPDH